jgi:hypothetical protein
MFLGELAEGKHLASRELLGTGQHASRRSTASRAKFRASANGRLGTACGSGAED